MWLISTSKYSWFPLFWTDKFPWPFQYSSQFSSIFKVLFYLKYGTIFAGFSLLLADKFPGLFQYFFFFFFSQFSSIIFSDFSSILSKIPWLFQSCQNSLTGKCLPIFQVFPVFKSQWEPWILPHQNETKMTDLGGTHIMYGKSIVILTLGGGATSCIICGRYEIMLFEKGVGPKLAASDWQIIDFNKSKYHALFHP